MSAIRCQCDRAIPLSGGKRSAQTVSTVGAERLPWRRWCAAWLRVVALAVTCVFGTLPVSYAQNPSGTTTSPPGQGREGAAAPSESSTVQAPTGAVEATSSHAPSVGQAPILGTQKTGAEPAQVGPASPMRPAKQQQPLLWRSVKVPADQLGRWSTSERLLPMPQEEFQRRIEQLQAPSDKAPATASSIAEAVYEATLQDSNLVGQGKFTIDHVGEGPVDIVLGTPRQPLIDPIWIEPDTLAPAQLGVNSQQQTVLRAANSGKVSFKWSAKGERPGQGRLNFRLSLATCAVNQLQLTLPARWRPHVEGAVVSAPRRAEEGQLQWTILLGGNTDFELLLTPTVQVHGDGPTVLCRTSPEYLISQQGLQLTADWKIEPIVGSIQQLAIEYHPSLTLSSARQGETLIPWEVQSSSDTAPKRVVLHFPEPIQQGGRTIRLVATAPLTVDQNWRLPKIYPAAAIRQDGLIKVTVDSPMVLRRIDTTNSRQTKRQQLTTPRVAEAFAFQPFNSNAEIDLYVAPQQDVLQADVATSVDFPGTEVTARVEAVIRAVQGDSFQLAATVSPDWIVDSVTTNPAGLISEWERRRTSSKDTELVVQLKQNITSDRPLRLAVNLKRRRAGLDQTFGIADLRAVTFHNININRQLVALRTAGPYRLDLQNADRLSRLNPRKLSPVDEALLGPNARGLIFVDDFTAENIQLRVVREIPPYSAAIRIQATMSNDSLTEAYRFACTPANGELDRVLVHFSEERAELPQWSQEGTTTKSHLLTSRRLTPEESVANNAPKHGETWEVILPAPQSEPFTLLAKRDTAVGASIPLALASLVRASSQRGEVVVRSTADRLPKVRTRRLVAIPSAPEPANQIRSTLVTLEYQPTNDLITPEGALVTLEIPTEHELAKGWIWHWHTDNYLDAAGTIEQHAKLQIEAVGRITLTAKFNNLETVPVVMVNGERSSVEHYDAATGELQINLPSDDRFPTVELIWRSRTASLSAFSKTTLNTPTVSLPSTLR